MAAINVTRMELADYICTPSGNYIFGFGLVSTVAIFLFLNINIRRARRSKAANVVVHNLLLPIHFRFLLALCAIVLVECALFATWDFTTSPGDSSPHIQQSLEVFKLVIVAFWITYLEILCTRSLGKHRIKRAIILGIGLSCFFGILPLVAVFRFGDEVLYASVNFAWLLILIFFFVARVSFKFLTTLQRPEFALKRRAVLWWTCGSCLTFLVDLVSNIVPLVEAEIGDNGSSSLTSACLHSLVGIMSFTVTVFVFYKSATNDTNYWRLVVSNILHASDFGEEAELSQSREMSDLVTPLLASRAAKFVIDFSHIQLGRQLGKGAFGTVHEGLVYGTKSAVKLLACTHFTSDIVHDFVQEASVLSELKHENVITFHGVSVQPPNMCIIVEFCDGGTLESWINSRKPHARASTVLSTSDAGNVTPLDLATSSPNRFRRMSTMLSLRPAPIDVVGSVQELPPPRRKMSLVPAAVMRRISRRASTESLRGSLVRELSSAQNSAAWRDYIMDALVFAIDAAKGLCYLHEHRPRIVHGDIKSGNCLVSESKVKLCDFGESVLGNISNSDSRVGGTAPYMSPEVVHAIQNPKTQYVPHPARDVYSFGILLWELITAQTPFADTRFQSQILKLIAAGETPSLAPPTFPDTLPGMKELLLQCWQTDPETRPVMRDVLRSLITEANLYTQQCEALHPHLCFFKDRPDVHAIQVDNHHHNNSSSHSLSMSSSLFRSLSGSRDSRDKESVGSPRTPTRLSRGLPTPTMKGLRTVLLGTVSEGTPVYVE